MCVFCTQGTLGVITEVQTRLFPLPTSVTAAVCGFNSVSDAASAATLILQMGIPIARCELLDKTTISAFNSYAKNVPDIEVYFNTHKRERNK
jgi:D-lactate dehydrogenase (cytochrome)